MEQLLLCWQPAQTGAVSEKLRTSGIRRGVERDNVRVREPVARAA